MDISRIRHENLPILKVTHYHTELLSPKNRNFICDALRNFLPWEKKLSNREFCSITFQFEFEDTRGQSHDLMIPVNSKKTSKTIVNKEFKDYKRLLFVK